MSVQTFSAPLGSQPAWVIPSSFLAQGSPSSSSMLANLCAFYPEDPSLPAGYQVSNRIPFSEMQQLLDSVAQAEMDPYGQSGNAKVIMYVSKALKKRVQRLSKCMVKVLTNTGKILTLPISIVPCAQILEMNRKCLDFLDMLKASRSHGLNESSVALNSLIENVRKASVSVFSKAVNYGGTVSQAILAYNVKVAGISERSS